METNTAPPETVQKAQIQAPSARLLFVSAAALFAEVMLIRWIGTEVRIFAFVQNLALIACFLGFGIGCFQKDEQPTLVPALQALTILVAMVSFPLHLWRLLLKSLSDFLSLSPDAALWNAYSIQSNQGRLIGLFFAIVVVAYLIALLSKIFQPFGRAVASYFDNAPDTLNAYSINLLGSLAGVWLMALVSFADTPPYVWFVLLFLLTA